MRSFQEQITIWKNKYGKGLTGYRTMIRAGQLSLVPNNRVGIYTSWGYKLYQLPVEPVEAKKVIEKKTISIITEEFKEVVVEKNENVLLEDHPPMFVDDKEIEEKVEEMIPTKVVKKTRKRASKKSK